MAATATAPPNTSPAGADEVDLEESNSSSELSDVANDDDISMRQDDVDDDGSNLTGQIQEDPNEVLSDSESALSDAQSVANSEANDTEAETERLYDTPQHHRQRDVVVDQYNDGEIFEHTPSKLQRTATIDEDDGHADDESIGEDGASSPSEKSDNAGSPRKNATTKDTSVDDEQQHDSQDRKRKRSLANDNSDSEQPLRKRTGSVGALEADIEEEVVVNADEDAAAVDRSRSQTPADDGNASPMKQDATTEDNTIERNTRSTRKTTRSESRRKSDEDDDEAEAPAEVEENESGEEPVSKPDTVEAEVDEEADAAAKSAEEAERKQEAFKDWSRIEDMFKVFRDRLYEDRLQKLEEEEQSLLADEATHHEFLNMKKCIDDKLEKTLREVAKEHELKTQAHEKRYVAERSQIWSQFTQGVREKREQTLAALNQEWYDVVAARRKAHSTPDYGVIFPKDASQWERNAGAYNTEVSTLSGMAKYTGFPAMPDIKGASAGEVQDDFAAIDQARRARQRPGFQPREEYQAPSFSRLGPAGEQFLRETPWANPNHTAHRAGPPQQPQGGQIGAESSAIGGLGTSQQPANPPVNASTTASVDGPISQQRSPALSNHMSQSPEVARNPLKRRTALPNPGRESSTAAA